jgi:predicted dinucleotide-utilizing enzyme
MKLAEVYPDGSVVEIDVAANYRRDKERWGQATATHNAKYVLGVLSGLVEPPDTTVEAARAEAARLDPAKTESIVVALPE